MHNRTAATLAAACWAGGAVGYLGAEAATAARYGPQYRCADDAISDLGTSASPWAALMNTAFCVQGTLFLAGALLAVRAVRPRRAPVVLVFAAANAVGNLLVAAVPSGEGRWHVVGAVLAIVGGNAAAVAGAHLVRSAPARWASVALGGTGLVCAALLTVLDWPSPAVLERISVYTILGWQLLAAKSLLPARRERTERTERDRGRR
jgi:hypothetical membrane protein